MRNYSAIKKAGKYIQPRLLSEIREWKDERNRLIHALLKQVLSTEDLENCALNGQALAKELSNKTNSIKRALQRSDSK